MDLIRDIFNSRDQDLIARTPLQSSNEDDIIFRRLADSGNYSVKSAYNFLQYQKGEWCSDDVGGLWKEFWRIRHLQSALIWFGEHCPNVRQP